jgi:hypothetical protein
VEERKRQSGVAINKPGGDGLFKFELDCLLSTRILRTGDTVQYTISNESASFCLLFLC